MSTDRWERKVRALLDKAEGTDNVDEAGAYFAKAQKLMLVYGLDEAMLDRSHEERVEPTTGELRFAGTYARVWVAAGFSILRASGCRGVYGKSWGTRTRPGNGYYISLVGMPDDVLFVQTVVASAQLQEASAFKAYKRELVFWSGMSSGEKTRVRKSFVVGYGQAVADKITTARRQAEQEATSTHGSGTDVVLASRTQRVAAEYRRLHPNTGKGRAVSAGGGAYVAGRNAGSRANVGGNSLGGRLGISA